MHDAKTATLTRLLLLSLVGALAAASPCDRPPSNVKTELPQVDPKAAEAAVTLPAPPAADAFVIKEAHDDGVLRIEGLAEHRDKHLDKTVTVRGKIVSIAPPCDPKEAKKRGETCKQPHLIIEDSDRATAKMFVIGFPEELPKIAKLQVGEVFDFKGSYAMTSQQFAATETGLVVLEEVNDTTVADVREKLKKQRRR